MQFKGLELRTLIVLSAKTEPRRLSFWLFGSNQPPLDNQLKSPNNTIKVLMESPWTPPKIHRFYGL